MSMSFEDLMKAAAEGGVQFTLVPVGEYEAYVKKAKGGRTSNGKCRIEATFAIMGGPHDGETVWNQFVVSPEKAQALGFFFRHMTVLGIAPSWFSGRNLDDTTMAALAEAITGARARIKVTISKVNGADRNNIDALSQSLTAPGQRMDGVSASPAGVPNVPAGVPNVAAPAAVAPAAPQVAPVPVPTPEQAAHPVNQPVAAPAEPQVAAAPEPQPQEQAPTTPAAPTAPF